jgi:hypothetical protein
MYFPTNTDKRGLPYCFAQDVEKWLLDIRKHVLLMASVSAVTTLESD